MKDEDKVKKQLINELVEMRQRIAELEALETQCKRAEERIAHLNAVLRAMRGVNQLIVREKDHDQLLQGFCDKLVETGGYYSAWIVVLNKEGEFVTAAQAGLDGAFSLVLDMLKRGEFTRCGRKALARSGVMMVEDVADTCADCPLADGCAGKGGMTVCLEHNHRVYGLLSVSAPANLVTEAEEQLLLAEVAGDIAFALHKMGLEEERRQAEEELQQSFEKLQRSMKSTVYAMSKIVETRDPYTAGHQWRVTRLACAIAKEIGLSGEQIDGIHAAGAIHDIGKIYLPAEILSKPSRLTEIEFSLIKTHPQLSCNILEKIEFPWPVAQIVLQHHERMDGSGYPQGLSGEDILMEARILGVADVVEAMSSHRPYRSALGIGKALEEISKNKGVLYDLRAVGACLKLFTEKGFKFEGE